MNFPYFQLIILFFQAPSELFRGLATSKIFLSLRLSVRYLMAISAILGWPLDSRSKRTLRASQERGALFDRMLGTDTSPLRLSIHLQSNVLVSTFNQLCRITPRLL